MILIDEDELDALRQITMSAIEIMDLMRTGDIIVGTKTAEQAPDMQAIFQRIADNIRIFDASTDQPTNN
jgi:hypothetical protein